MKKEKQIQFEKKLFSASGTMEDMYDHFNETYFKCRLPMVRIGFYPGKKMDKSYAWTLWIDGHKHATHILINDVFKEWDYIVQQNILHEMCHVALPQRVSHGPRFKKEKRRLILAGAFDSTL